MTSTPHIVGEVRPPSGLIVRALRKLKARVHVWRPRLWISYVVARDLRLRMIGCDPPPDVDLLHISAPGQEGFEDLVRMSRRMRVRRELCEQYLASGAVGVMAYVIENGRRYPAGMGWMTQFAADIPFLNARFNGAGRASLLYQDFVLPAFRGRKLQTFIGKRRMILAKENGAEWAYGYIRRANTASLRNAITYQSVAIVHNLHYGEWATAHVSALGKRTCADLPFEGWPRRRWFYIKPRRD